MTTLFEEEQPNWAVQHALYPKAAWP